MTTEDVREPGGARAVGLATIQPDGTVLDTWFPAPALTASATGAAAGGTVRLDDAEAQRELGPEAARITGHDGRRDVDVVAAGPPSRRWTTPPPTHTTCTFGCTC